MLAVLQQLCVLYIFIFLGWMFGKRKPEFAETNILSFLLVNLMLPCKVFQSFSGNFSVAYVQENYMTFVIAIALLLLLVVVSKLLADVMTKHPFERRVFRYSFAISNYAYLGYVLIENLFGEKGLTNMILFCIPFAFYTYSFGYALLTGKGATFKKLINPMTIAIFLGMIFGLCGISIPAVLKPVLQMSSACVGPLSMLLTGLVLSNFNVKELLMNGKAYVFTVLRLLVLPLFVLGFCNLFGLFITLPEAVFPYAVFMGCMPCGLNTVVFPKLVGEDCRLGAQLAFVTCVASLISLPLWIHFLT